MTAPGRRRRVVVVGASAAGLATVEALSRLSFSGEVVIIGDEPTFAHDRPPLSKQIMSGEWTPDRIELVAQNRRDDLRAIARLGRRAVALDEIGRQLALDDGTTVDYDEVVIATGVRPRRLPLEQPAGVHTLRTLEDALAIRAGIGPDKRILVVGAGFLGLEVAATARRSGANVTVVEPLHAPLASRLGADAAARLLDLHRGWGVDIRLGAQVVGFSTGPSGKVASAVLSDGGEVKCSTAIVAIGCVPNVEWLAGTSLDISDGVACDAECRAAPGVWAAGDVARWHHSGLGRSLRIEHRMNATEQGIAVAGNIAGPLRPFTPTPFFWTDHYDVKIQVAGVVDPAAEVTSQATDAGGQLSVYRLHGVLTAVLGWNAAAAMMPARRELRERLSTNSVPIAATAGSRGRADR